MRHSTRSLECVRLSIRGSTLVLLNVIVLLTAASAQVRRLDPAALLDAYAQGRYDEALAPVRMATRDHARDFRQRLVLSGGQWVDALASDHSRRALVAAAFALEAEWLRAERGEWAAEEEGECAGRCVIEWACTLLQTRGVPDEGERVWMLASIALAGGVRDWTFLQTPLSRPTQKTIERGHVHHAIARLPDEPRFRLARAIALASRHAVTGEMETPRDGTRTSQIANPLVRLIEAPSFVLSTLEQRRTTLVDYAREVLESLLSDTGVGDEARLRLGYLYWVRGDKEEALAAQRAVAVTTHDSDLRVPREFSRGAGFASARRSSRGRGVLHGGPQRTSSLAVGDARACGVALPSR